MKRTALFLTLFLTALTAVAQDKLMRISAEEFRHQNEDPHLALLNKEIDRLLIYLRTSDVMPKEANWNKRQRENLERMKSGDIYSVADVYKFLAKREADKSLSSGEKKMLISARKVLFSEIQLVKGTSPEAIEAAVANAINGK